jgi:predicted TIM-barrel fold metal-dependent hydrolase
MHTAERKVGMQLKLLLSAALLAPAIVASAQSPVADHHQHLFSPALIAMAGPTTSMRVISAADLLPLLDSAGIKRAVVLSAAYMYGSPSRKLDDEYAKVRAENDWAGAQAALYPVRLRAFCGMNPLKDYALAEIERCSRDPNLRYGLKFHLGNSDVQLDDTAHVAQLRRVFRAANERHMAIVVHMRASISRKRPYGAQQARIFLEQVLPMAPDIPVQIAHMAGTGPGYDDPPADSAMAVFAEAVQRGDPRTKNLWFDVTSSADRAITPDNAALLVKRIRQVGVQRVLYGTDAALGDNMRPREAWEIFTRLPLTKAEIATVASNLAPYFR